MKIEKITDIAEKHNVSIERTKELTAGLTPYIDERKLLITEFETVSKLEITKENIQVFRGLRLKFQKNRTQGIKKWHKTAKEIPLRLGQLIDAIQKNELQVNETHEEFLQKAENHFEILEKERLDKLQSERIQMILPYLEDVEGRDFSSMETDVWNAFFSIKKQAYEDKIKAELEAEKERIEKEKAEKAEQERIKKENERLRKEVEQKEKERIAELEKIRKGQAAKEEKERKRLAELAKIEAEKRSQEEKERQRIAKIESDKQAEIQAELREKAEAERKEKECIEKELREKAEAEAQRLAEIEAKKQAELSKGDSDKVNDLIDDLTLIAGNYIFESEKNKKMYREVGQLIVKVINHIQK